MKPTSQPRDTAVKRTVAGQSQTVVLWLNYKVPSENQIRHKHWSVAVRFSKAARAAWLSALSESDARYWIQTIFARVQNQLGTLLPYLSEPMTETPASLGNTPKCLQPVQKEP